MEFNVAEYLATNIVNRVKKGKMDKEEAAIMAVNYMAKGFFAKEDVARIDAEITAWEESQYIEPSVVEETETEIIEDSTNEEMIEETTTEPTE